MYIIYQVLCSNRTFGFTVKSLYCTRIFFTPCICIYSCIYVWMNGLSPKTSLSHQKAVIESPITTCTDRVATKKFLALTHHRGSLRYIWLHPHLRSNFQDFSYNFSKRRLPRLFLRLKAKAARAHWFIVDFHTIGIFMRNWFLCISLCSPPRLFIYLYAKRT